ncbi:hypothetical protein CHRYSEOSP005_14790 [Chryseobacterium sp. Alg-005]
MKTEVMCNRCNTVIANDDGVFLIPVKTRTRFNYETGTANIQCHVCYYVNIFKGNELVPDCDKINNRYQLEQMSIQKKQ